MPYRSSIHGIREVGCNGQTLCARRHFTVCDSPQMAHAFIMAQVPMK